eukprot:gene4538-9005_t
MISLTITLVASLLASSNAFRLPPLTAKSSLTASSLRNLSPLRASTATPHGGVLVNTLIKDDAKKAAVIKSADFELELDERQLCDVELLMQGGFSPLTGFMNEADYKSVVNDLKLTSGVIFGLPVVFDTDDARVVPGAKALLKYKDVPIALLEVESKYIPNKALEAKKCYGTSSIEHPGTMMISMERKKFYVGKITGLNVPTREFPCLSPQEVRDSLPGGVDVVAFQALDAPEVGPNAVVLVHPTCGPTQPDDIPGNVRYKTYEVLKEEVQNPRIRWAYLPYSMHMAGPREAIQHMIIRKNYGCTHFIIGRDMAGCKSSLDGEDFYGPYDAQNFAIEKSLELGVKPVPSLNLVYTEEEGYSTAEFAKEKKLTIKTLSGTKFRQMLRAGDDIPTWFAFASVVKVLREEAPDTAK